MIFIVKRENLLAPLQQIVRFIETRPKDSILSHVLMGIADDRLILTGTNLEIQLSAKINITAIEPGSIIVPAKECLAFCKLLPKGADIKFELRGDKIQFVSNGSHFSLGCLPADNYPEFSNSDLDHQMSINAGKLKKALDKTLFCMAKQDVRYYLNGLLLDVSNSKLKLVASDGHRLSVYEDNLDQPTGFEARIILPRKGVIELRRLLDDPEADLAVEFYSNKVRIYIKNLIFSSKLVDAKFPEFGKVFQQKVFPKIDVSKQMLKDALTRVAILSNKRFKGVTFDIAYGSLTISTHNPEHNEAKEELPISYKGEPFSSAFNVHYLLDAVSNLYSEMAVLTISSNASCCFIDEPCDCGYKFIVMSMRL